MNVPKSDRLKQVRKNLRLTQKEMAETLGVSVSYISDLETGRRNVSAKFVDKLHDAYGVSQDWMFTVKGYLVGKMYDKDTRQNAHPDIHQNDRFSKNLTKEDLEYLVDAIESGLNDRKPTRYAKTLTEQDILFEYNLGYSTLKDVFDDYQSLKRALPKLGAPDFLLERFPLFQRSFRDYFNELLEEHEEYFGGNFLKEYQKKEHRLYIIEKIFHPQIEHERLLLSKLIKYISTYADMFKGSGINHTKSK